MLDLIIRNGSVVDGTGAPRLAGDVGVDGGRVVAIGDLALETGRRELDADGRVVAPGFVDVHTHYDAQAFWDPTLSPSPLHGVTTVVGGNCGFSIAPLSDDATDGEYLMRMLARVEGIPLATLQAGAPFDWRSTADYLDRLDGTLAVNAGFKVGHSALRRVVMGAEATQRAATSVEVAAMQELLAQGLAAGGLGFSSSWSRTHNDGDGRRVPSRVATRDEILALCRVCRDHPGTSLEFIPHVTSAFDDEALDMMSAMSRVAQRPLNWNVLPVTAATRDTVAAKLRAGTHAAEHGGRVLALTVPMTVPTRMSFTTGFMLDALPGWEDVMWLPLDDRWRALADPDVRHRLALGAASDENPLPHIARWSEMEVFETFAPELAPLRGRRIGQVAADRGHDPFDVLLDVVLADDLRATFGPAATETRADWEARAEVWLDGRAVVGASDAGAHLDLFASFHYTTVLLAEAVRRHEVVTLEQAVALLAAAPADLYGLAGRGRLVPGAWADVVVFDPDTVGPGPVETRFDLPGGAGRLYAEAVGIDAVIVAGVPVVRDGVFAGDAPGTIIRSGRDTVTPAMR